VFLCIAKQIGNSTYFTNEEQENMNIELNPTAYFDYLSTYSKETMGELEQKVIAQIIGAF
jgi:hypothetical protein